MVAGFLSCTQRGKRNDDDGRAAVLGPRSFVKPSASEALSREFQFLQPLYFISILRKKEAFQPNKRLCILLDKFTESGLRQI